MAKRQDTSKTAKPSQTKPGKRQRVTLAHVAQACGYSVSTVSAVLNDQPHCWASEATREKVLTAAGELGYRPNLAARSLRSGRTHTLGFVTIALTIQVTSQKIMQFESVARENGYLAIISHHPNDPKMESSVLRRLRDRGVDGIAIYPTEEGDHAELRALWEEGFPIVTIEGLTRMDFDCDDVSFDYVAGGRMQAQHLLELGRKRVAIANLIPDCLVTNLREGAFRKAYQEAGAPKPLAMNIESDPFGGDLVTEPIYQQVLSFLRKHGRELDAVAGADFSAGMVLRACLELGLRVPDDIAIIGFDGTQLSANAAIPISTIAQNPHLMGEAAFDLLHARIDGATTGRKPKRVTVPPTLIARATTGQP